MHRRLLWQLFGFFLLISLIPLMAAAWYASVSMRDIYLEQAANDLEARARLMEKRLLEHREDGETLQAYCREAGKESQTRFTLVRADGRVLCDSESDPQHMENHADRPEIREAVMGHRAVQSRFSATLGTEMMYVAVPLGKDIPPAAVLRASLPVLTLRKALEGAYHKVIFGAVVVALLSAAAAWLVSRRISHPLETMTRGALRFAEGDFAHKLPVPHSRELAALAEALNRMADQLDDRLKAIAEQHNMLAAVLASMVEGVVAVDVNGRLIATNNACARILDLPPGEWEGRDFAERIRHPELVALIRKALEGEESELEIALQEAEERYLQVHATALRQARGPHLGALAVLNDVTRLRRLQRIRRDFVANVSHELKTPITSIKGFVETLLDGALNDPEDARRFLVIIGKHAERMNSIIEDLLALSRIEQAEGREELVLERHALRPLLETAVQLCGIAAQEKNIPLSVEGSEILAARINPPLLEQAVVNLIDNAVKYSEPGRPVRISVSEIGPDVVIEVADQGVGIAKEHLPRLFERFYRVDKARSRKQGGTGLGLSIVRHIVQLHGGRVRVESTPGEGSRFFIHLGRD